MGQQEPDVELFSDDHKERELDLIQDFDIDIPIPSKE